MIILQTEEIKIKCKKAQKKNHFIISLNFIKDDTVINSTLERSDVRELIEKLDNLI